MDYLQAFWLAVIQGLSEFLPISSSAHLILPSQVLEWPDQGLAFDVAVHVGSLIAVIVYFREDIVALTQAWLDSLFVRRHTAESRLAWYIILATIPAGLAGLFLGDFIEQNLRSMLVIAVTTIVFGLLLGWADWRGKRTREMQQFSAKSAFLIGVAQAIALIPGTSRSGITITAALALGFDRETAARFSFLLAIPIIVLSGGYKGVQLLNSEAVDWIMILVGTSLSGITAYLCIRVFLSVIKRVGMFPFVVYRLVLGMFLLYLIYQQ